MARFVLLIGAALALAYERLTGEKGQLFQAIAHFYVAGLFGIAWADWHWHRYIMVKVSPYTNDFALRTREANEVKHNAIWYAGIALAVSLVELYAFLAGISST